MGRGNNINRIQTATTGSDEVGTRRRTATAATQQRTAPATIRRLKSISLNKSYIPETSLSYSGVEYEYETSRNCTEGRCDGVCRCESIGDIQITEIDASAIQSNFIDSLRDEISKQRRGLRSFLTRSNAGKELVESGASEDEKLIAFAEHRRQKQINARRYYNQRGYEDGKTVTYDEDLIRRIEEIDESDRTVFTRVIDIEISADSIEIPTSRGYYGEEVDGAYVEEGTLKDISDKFVDYLRRTDNTTESRQAWVDQNLNIQL